MFIYSSQLIIGNRRNKNKLTYQNRQDDENFRSFSSVVLRPLKLIAYCRNKNKRNYTLSLRRRRCFYDVVSPHELKFISIIFPSFYYQQTFSLDFYTFSNGVYDELIFFSNCSLSGAYS